MSKQIIELKNITMKEGYINSIDLTKIINESRKFEFEQLQDKGLNKKDNVVLLQHKDLMKKIKKELEVLKSLGLEGERNISLGSYVDIQGQKRPCYKLNRDGMLQILNSESTIVRALTIKYINYLEEQNNDLKQDNNALYEVATSDEEKAIRQYEANKIKYALRNVEKLLSECDYTNIEKTVDDILDFHINQLKKKDRYLADQKYSKTEYKQKIKKFVYTKLDKVLLNTKDIVTSNLIERKSKILQKEMKETINRTNSKKISAIKKECTKTINEYKDYINYIEPNLEDYNYIPYSGFSINCIEDYNKKYYNWKKNFPKEYIKIDKTIDFTKPVDIWLYFDHKEKIDVTNLSKTFIDMLCNIYSNALEKEINDNKIQLRQCATSRYVDSYENSAIYYVIRQRNVDK